MRVVLQRVARAEVRIGSRSAGRIERGYVLLTGFHRDDGESNMQWMADKVMSLRLFPEEQTAAEQERGRPSSFSRDITDIGGDILVISQFTLYGDARKGRRPSFIDAAPPDDAVPLYERFVELVRQRAPARVATGEFGAMMHVELVNDGPVTLILER